MVVALAGNPNSGKSSLFNALTGKKRKVSNFPGVSVDVVSASFQGLENALAIDLPGLYSLNAYTPEEELAAEYLASGKADAIINVADAGSLERALYLTLQLTCFGLPMVLALNMADELKARGGKIDTHRLSRELGVNAVLVSGQERTGLSELLDALKNAQKPKRVFTCAKPESGDAEFAAAVGASYAEIERICAECVRTKGKKQTRSVKADKILTSKYFGLPIFVAIMLAGFVLCFSVVGGSLSGLFTKALDWVLYYAETLLNFANVPVLAAFVSDGLFAGLRAVAGFMPLVVCTLFFLSLLEDAGYLARVAYILNLPLSRIGLSGRSAVPVMLGFGCTVPAVAAVRAMGDAGERTAAAIVAAYMPCGAKLAVFGALAGAFFGQRAYLVMLFLYAVNLVVAVIVAKVIRIGKKHPTFMLELPEYRFPSVKSILVSVRDRTSSFMKKTVTLVLAVCAVVWLMSYYDFAFMPSLEGNMLAVLCGRLAFALEPLGFADSRALAALVSGAASKEAVCGVLELLSQGRLDAIFSPRSALSFLCFVSLCPPCTAGVAAMAREIGAKKTAAAMLTQLAVAYAVSFVVFNLTRGLL